MRFSQCHRKRHFKKPASRSKYIYANFINLDVAGF